MFGNYYVPIKVLVEALNNPHNRHETRIKHNCSDAELYANPQWLIDHWLQTHPKDRGLK